MPGGTVQLVTALGNNGELTGPIIFDEPSGPPVRNGQILYEVNGPYDRTGIWVGRDTGEAQFWRFIPGGTMFGSSSPTGVVPIHADGQRYINTSSGAEWYSRSGSWVAM